MQPDLADSVSTPAPTTAPPFAWLAPAPLLTLILPATLLTHVVTQATAIFRRHVTPARRTFVTANFTVLLPVFAHLLPHLPPLVRRQVAPRCLRPDATSRA